MTADSFKRRLVALALELREDAAATFGGDGNAACDRCGRAGFEPAGLETETVVEYYALVCPADGCTGEATFAHLYVAADDGQRVVERDFAGAGCTNDGCDPRTHLEADLIRDERPFRRLEYFLPVAGLLETPVRERAVDGADGTDDEVLELCRACHVRMGTDEDRSDRDATESELPAPAPQ